MTDRELLTLALERTMPNDTAPTSTRARLHASVQSHAEWSASQHARALGVSRERIRQLATSERIRLPVGSAGAPRRPTRPTTAAARCITGGIPILLSTTIAGAVSELLVAADILSRGYMAYAPLAPSAWADLLLLDGAGRMERIEVRSAKRTAGGTLQYARPVAGTYERLALVVTGEPVQYEPAFPDDQDIRLRSAARFRRRLDGERTQSKASIETERYRRMAMEGGE